MNKATVKVHVFLNNFDDRVLMVQVEPSAGLSAIALGHVPDRQDPHVDGDKMGNFWFYIDPVRAMELSVALAKAAAAATEFELEGRSKSGFGSRKGA